MGLKNILIKLTALIFLALAGTSLAADKPVSQVDLDKLQEQVRSIDKEIAVLKEGTQKNLEALKDRQNDITAGQATSLAAIANQTTSVGNYISLTGVLVTLLVFGAGLITYFSATQKAKEEAQVASKIWFDENLAELKKRIAELQAEARSALEAIKHNSAKVSLAADTANAAIADKLKTLDPPLVNTPTASTENEFTDDDFYVRGLTDYANNHYQSALHAFKNAYLALNCEALISKRAQYLLAQGKALVELGEPEQAVAIFDDIDRRFGNEIDPAVRETVAATLLRKSIALHFLGKFDKTTAAFDELDRRFSSNTTLGVCQVVCIALQVRSYIQVLFAKERWTEQPIRESSLAIAENASHRALLLCGKEARADVLGGLGYVQFLSGKPAVARIITQECLRLGGQKALDVQLAGAKLHRVEPLDTAYEKMLAEIWEFWKTV